MEAFVAVICVFVGFALGLLLGMGLFYFKKKTQDSVSENIAGGEIVESYGSMNRMYSGGAQKQASEGFGEIFSPNPEAGSSKENGEVEVSGVIMEEKSTEEPVKSMVLDESLSDVKEEEEPLNPADVEPEPETKVEIEPEKEKEEEKIDMKEEAGSDDKDENTPLESPPEEPEKPKEVPKKRFFWQK